MTLSLPYIPSSSLRWGASLLLVAALLTVLSPSAHAQSPVESLIEQAETTGANVELMRSVASRAEASGLNAERTAGLLKPAVALAERDLPTGPLLNKTLEGLAKQVPPARMTPVLQNMQTYTEQGDALVSTWLGREEVQTLVGDSENPSSSPGREQLVASIAEARQQNVPGATVESFLNALPESVQRRPVPLSDVSVAVSVMPDLPTSKNARASRQLLTSALDAGYDAESLRQLPSALERAERASQRPAAALAEETARAISKGTPAANVLRTLFQGAVPGGGPPSNVGNGAPGPPGQGKPPGENGRPPGAGPPDDPEGPPDDPEGPPDDPGQPPDDPGGGPSGSG